MTEAFRTTLERVGELVDNLKDIADSGGDSEHAFNLFVDQTELDIIAKSLSQMFQNMEDEIAGLNKDRTDEPFWDDPDYAKPEKDWVRGPEPMLDKP
jgi:Zn-dependent M32 family carboxypeptidase